MVKSLATEDEKQKRMEFLQHIDNLEIPDEERLFNSALYLRRQELAHILAMDQLYRMILDSSGVITEFGGRYGRNTALFNMFRAIYEPYNYSRKVICFDTFEGFAGAGHNDSGLKDGDYSINPDYVRKLMGILEYHEYNAPISHVRKYDVIRGDIIEMLPFYLEKNPGIIISMAYFDLDLYRPTKEAIKAIKPLLHHGSILAFDEICHPEFPGETIALIESELPGKIYRSTYNPTLAWVIYGGYNEL